MDETLETLETLPKDILVLLALELDFNDFINLSQTSSKINEKICRNRYFWINKLMKDYGILENEAKNKYLLIKNLLYTDPNQVLNLGFKTENLKLIKSSIELGADLMYIKDYYLPISKSLAFEDENILKYFLEISFDDFNIFHVINDVIIIFSYNKYNREQKCKMTLKLYSIFLPYISKKLIDKKDKKFWITVLRKLEEFHDDKHIDDAFFNKWIDFYRKMAL